MIRWSIPLFRVRGIQLALHASFLPLVGYAAWEGWAEAHWAGACWSAGTLLAFFCCVILHELGHSLVALHYGIRVPRILLMPIGGMAEFESIPREPGRELRMTLAGPAVNFAIAAVLQLLLMTGWVGRWSETAEVALGLIRSGNLLMGCFNLLPAFPMDGGRILRSILARRLAYLDATEWAARVGKLVAAAGIAVALMAPGWFESELSRWLVAALFGFVMAVGELELRALRRHETEVTRWRAMGVIAVSDSDAVASTSRPTPVTRSSTGG